MIFDGYSLNVQKTFAQQYSTDPIAIPSMIGSANNSVIKNNPNTATHIINGLNDGSVCNPLYGNNTHLPTITSTETLMHNGKVTIGPQQLTNTEILGPDHFRFIYSYWTINAANQGLGVATGSVGHNSIPHPLETDVAGGPNTLAVILHYEGVANLQGITAALKLPPGFEATIPSVHNLDRNDIAYSSYQGTITKGSTIVLVFPVTITDKVLVQKPYPGLLALHFLKQHDRSLQYNLMASGDDSFVKALTIKNNLSPPVATTGSSLTKTCSNGHEISVSSIKGNYTIDKPYDFVHQVTGIVLKVTGIENLNINYKIDSEKFSTLPNVTYGKPTTLEFMVSNSGDAPMYNLKVLFQTPAYSGTIATPAKGSLPTFFPDPTLTTIPTAGALNNNNSRTDIIQKTITDQLQNPNNLNPPLDPNNPTPTQSVPIPFTSTTTTNINNGHGQDVQQFAASSGAVASTAALVGATEAILGPSLFNIGYLAAHSSTKVHVIVVGYNPNSYSISSPLTTSVQYTDSNGYLQSAFPYVPLYMPAYVPPHREPHFQGTPLHTHPIH